MKENRKLNSVDLPEMLRGGEQPKNLMPGLYQRSYHSISPRINFKFKGRNYFPDQSNALLTTLFSDVQSIDQLTSKTIVKIFVDN